MNDRVTIDGLLALPARDRLAIIEALWDSLRVSPASVPVPDWHRELLAERMREDDAAPEEADDWSKVRARIERR
jgi:putative addiction module component (TIGR02574 family)